MATKMGQPHPKKWSGKPLSLTFRLHKGLIIILPSVVSNSIAWRPGQTSGSYRTNPKISVVCSVVHCIILAFLGQESLLILLIHLNKQKSIRISTRIRDIFNYSETNTRHTIR